MGSTRLQIIILVREIGYCPYYFQNIEIETYFASTGKGKETNMIDEGDRRGVEKPNVYFANEAEEVRLTGTSSRGLHGDLADDEVDEKKQTRANSKTQKNITSSSKKEVEARRRSPDEKNSLTNNSSRELKERGSEGKKKSKRVMSSPWILILTILFLFILACIILAVLR